MAYIFLDCEMGSVDLEYSLLSSYFLVVDGNFQKIDELELFVKPDDGILDKTFSVDWSSYKNSFVMTDKFSIKIVPIELLEIIN